MRSNDVEGVGSSDEDELEGLAQARCWRELESPLGAEPGAPGRMGFGTGPRPSLVGSLTQLRDSKFPWWVPQLRLSKLPGSVPNQVGRQPDTFDAQQLASCEPIVPGADPVALCLQLA